MFQQLEPALINYSCKLLQEHKKISLKMSQEASAEEEEERKNFI